MHPIPFPLPNRSLTEDEFYDLGACSPHAWLRRILRKIQEQQDDRAKTGRPLRPTVTRCG